MKISPPCEVSMWEIIFVLDVLLTISSMTERPERRKLVRQEDCLELTSVGVIRKLPEQWCSSVAVLPLQAIYRYEKAEMSISMPSDYLGVHHFSVAVLYSQPPRRARVMSDTSPEI